MAPMMLYFANIYSARHLKIAAAVGAVAATSSEFMVLYYTLLCMQSFTIYIYTQHNHLSCVQFSYKSSLRERVKPLCAGWKNGSTIESVDGRSPFYKDVHTLFERYTGILYR